MADHWGDRALAIARKEARLLIRDPAYLGLAIVVPLLLILLLGYQLSLDVKGLLVAVVDHDRSPWSRQYIDGFVHSEYFRLVGTLDSAAEAREWMRSGRARVVIDIPPDFGRRLSAGERATVGVTVDGSFPTRGQIATGYVEAINTSTTGSSSRLTGARPAGRAGRCGRCRWSCRSGTTRRSRARTSSCPACSS